VKSTLLGTRGADDRDGDNNGATAGDNDGDVDDANAN